MKKVGHYQAGYDILTKRQVELLGYVALGYENARIALVMKTTKQTVKNQLTNIFDRLAVENRVGAVLLAGQLGLLPGWTVQRSEEP